VSSDDSLLTSNESAISTSNTSNTDPAVDTTSNTTEWSPKPKLSFQIAGKDVSIELEDGVGVEVDFSGWKLPKEDWKKRKVEEVQLAAGAGIRFELAMGGGVGAGGKVKFTGKKKGEGDNAEWSVDVSSSAYAKSEFWGEIAIGGFVGIKGANISASFYTRPKLVAESSLGVEGGVSFKNGQWGGKLAFPFDLKGTASAEVGVKANWEFLFWDGEFGRFSFGEWIVATGGMAARPETSWPGPRDTSTKVAPYFNWGDTPKPEKMGSSRRPTTAGFTYFGGNGNNTTPPPSTGGGGSARPRGKGYCFPAGTLVHTADGLRPIESLAEGTEIITRDAATGASTTAVVEGLDRHEGSFDLVHFGVGADRIVTTGGHRFLTAEAYWSRADDLRPGQALQSGTVAHLPVPMQLVDTVIYNLRVRNQRSYLVGQSGLLVRDH